VKTETKPHTPQAMGKLTASAPKSKDVFEFAPDEEQDQGEPMAVKVKWVKSGSDEPATEWEFTVMEGATVTTLRNLVDHSTGMAFKDHGATLKHKSKVLSDPNASLESYGITNGSEVTITIQSDGGVGLPPTMVGNEFPGVPLAKPKKKTGDNLDKKRERFTKEEAEDLIKGVDLYGLGQWAQIRASSFGQSGRSGVDLKDKWRNLVQASARPEGFKFRVEYLNDPQFLNRVKTANDNAMNRSVRQQ
jgi:hypothetical protein